MLENKVNGKKYIGQSINVERRWKQHIKDSKNKVLKSRYLYRSFNKYGVENFNLAVIEENIPYSKINEREQYWIECYQTYAPNGYNLTKGGEGVLGLKYSEEQRKKISERVLKWHKENKSLFLNAIKKRDCSAAYTAESIEKRKKSWRSNPKNKETAIKNLRNYEETVTEEQVKQRCKKAVETKKKICYDFYNFSFGKMNEKEKIEMYNKISKNNKRSQTILMIDQNNNIIKEFHSIGEAGRYLHNKYNYSKNSKQNIRQVLDTNKIAYGFVWKRK